MPLKVVWFVSSGMKPWEKRLLLDLAEALVPRVGSLKLFSPDVAGWEGLFPLLSWRDRDFVSRAKTLLVEGRLWHFWGQAPPWARAVAFRAGLIHTQWRDLGPWRGLASTIVPCCCDGSGVRLSPFFRSRSLWLGETASARSSEGTPLHVLALPKGRPVPSWAESLSPSPVLLGGGLREEELLPLWRERGGVLLLPWVTADLSWIAAQGALVGVPTLARPGAALDELLGSEGYVPVRGDDGESWKRAAASFRDGLPPVAAAARRRLEDRYSMESAVGGLLGLYGRLVEVAS